MGLALLGALLMVSCAPNLVTQGRKLTDQARYEQARECLFKELSVNPTNAAAWREVGIAYYKEGRAAEADVAFKNAVNQPAPDPAAYVYLGLIQENKGYPDSAVGYYIAALDRYPTGRSAATVRKRLDQLLQEELRNRLPQVVAGEGQLDASAIPENSVAVLNFGGARLDPEVAPVARGLSALVAADLAKVSSIRSIERLKVETLLAEQRLRDMGVADSLSAVQKGYLLGAHTVVTGELMSIGDKIRLDAALVDVVRATPTPSAPTEDALDQFYRFQKRFVFSLLDSLHVTLTPEERARLDDVPTESSLAFLAYCRGLQYQGEGYYKAAQVEFQQALKHDGSFSQARTELDNTNTLMSLQNMGDVSAGQVESAVRQDFLGGAPDDLGASLQGLHDDLGIVPADGEQDGTSDSEEPPVPAGVGAAQVRGNLDGK